MGNKTSTTASTTPLPKKFVDHFGSMLTPKGMSVAWSFYGPSILGGMDDGKSEEDMIRKQQFMRSWGKVEHTLALDAFPTIMRFRKLLKPGKEDEYVRKMLGVSVDRLDKNELNAISEEVRKDAAKLSKYRTYFEELSDEQLIAAAHGFRETIEETGLYKKKRSSATAAVAAVAPVAVAAATGGLAGGGHRAQNRLLMALLLGLALWLLLKPKAGCGCSACPACPDRDRA